jgi:hypothetical protein
MEVFKPTVSTVFGNPRRYVIPLFQRPYVWSRESQWEPLWEDIVERADLELNAKSSKDRESPPHFLGAIVIQQRRTYGDELLAHDVIDGQQRLTTFQILLFALRDIAAAGDDKNTAESIASWTRNGNPIAEPDVEQFKVWPTSRDVEQFRLVATAGSREAVEKAHPVPKVKRPPPRPRMVDAYLYFHEEMHDWVHAEGPGAVGARTKALRRVFDRHMQLVSIELGEHEEPQAIFETLNARGVPLLASDLLRNHIFARAKGDAAKLHQKYWTRFEVPDDEEVTDGLRFWEIEQRQGRLNRARLDLFVQHYLAMKRGRDIPSGRLFPEYKEWVESAQFGSVEDELKDFTSFADHFASLIRPDLETALGPFAERLRVLDTSTIYPLVLSLLARPTLTEKERLGIFTDLESFMVRRLVCQRSAKGYTRLFLQLLRDFEAAEPTRAAFRALLAAGKGEYLDWPSDDEFRTKWLTLDAYQELKAARVEMMLRAIDASMTTAATESITIHGKLTVEHVMPQKWEKHWPLPTDVDIETARTKRWDVVHDFGNLTLLTSPLNSKISNGPAATKLPQIAGKTALRLSATFQGRTTWNESDIAERGAAMFEHAKKVWPGP